MPGGNIVHFNAIRVRVVGSGNFRCTFYGFDKVESQVLVPLAMSNPNAREMTRLANFKVGRAILRMETTAINEVMKVNNVTIFAKPLWSEYPG